MFSGISDLFALGGGTAVGLSIGSSSIKLVELKKSGKTWKLLHFGMIQIAEDAIVNREIMNQISVVESLKSLVGQIKLRNKNICSSLSGTSVIIKRMAVEVQNIKELQEQIFWEAEQYLPFDISDVVMDYQLFTPKKEKNADVLLVAVKTSTLDSYTSCITESGLKPKVMDVDFFALQNLYESSYTTNPSEAVAIVDIGATSLKIVVVHNGIPVFTKDAGIGGRNLTAEIQKHLNLSYSDAETLKVGDGGQGTPQEVSDLMSIMSENFASEIKRAIDFYDASSSGAPISYVLLTGGSSKIPDLPRVIEDTIRKPTQLLNPFQNVSYDQKVFSEDYIQSIAPVAAVPLGLATRMSK